MKKAIRSRTRSELTRGKYSGLDERGVLEPGIAAAPTSAGQLGAAFSSFFCFASPDRAVTVKCNASGRSRKRSHS